jgi:DNA-binding GntR family transcriptional regulator
MTRRERTASGPTPRLYQRAFDILAHQIGEGTLPAGTRLQESGVAQQFGISRAPARRALAELAESGLLEKPAGRGYLVRRAPAGKPQLAPPTSLPTAGARLLPLPTWESIYGEVENEIIARIAVASWRLNEAELARCYGVSRTVTRDVVGRLQQRGLLRKDDSARWYAPALTPDHVGELYELRWLLEPVALTKAAPRVPAGFLARLRGHLDDAMAHAHSIGGATLDALEEELHVALLGHCGNHTLMQAISLHQSLLVAHRFLYRWTPRLFATEPFLPEHREIVERLEQGKVKAAAKALEHHLRVSRERAVARIDVIRRDLRPDELPYLQRLRSA